MTPKEILEAAVIVLSSVTMLLSVATGVLAYSNRNEIKKAEKLRRLRILSNAAKADKELQRLERHRREEKYEFASAGRH